MSKECKSCKVTGCCQNCSHYRGGIEFIPTRINISCDAREGDEIVLPYNGYPMINGEVEKNCASWEKRAFSRVSH